jgi:hypothetical protein
VVSVTGEREALAIYGLKKLVARYASRLFELLDEGASAESLSVAVGNFQVALGDEVTFDALVDEGRGVQCDDCGVDVAPCDADGYPVEDGWEGYMVHDQVWEAAGGEGHLCVGCLEARLGRRLTVGDFTDCPLNTDPAQCRSERLRGRLQPGQRACLERLYARGNRAVRSHSRA